MVFRMDRQYEKWAGNNSKTLKLQPSDYFRRNVRATFQDDPMTAMTGKYYGEDNFMWGSDYPHADATWPNSVKAIARAMEGVSEEVRDKIVCGNATKLYHIEKAVRETKR